MNKKMKKIFSVVLTFAFVMAMGSSAFAAIAPKPPTSTGLTAIGANALGWVQWFGYAIAVGMLLYIGIKYMMASANEKADLKKGAINYVIGAVLVVAASSLVGVIIEISENVTK